MLSQIRRAIWSIDPNQPIKSVQLMDDVIYRDLSAPRFRGYLFAAFAAMALIIAIIGIYGIVSYSVAMRTHEMGVRMALGACRSVILRLVLTEGLTMVLLGIALGIAGSLALTRTIEAYLYGVRPVDAFTFSAVAAAFLLVGLLACWMPARRASRADPLAVLRCE
jgi:putative ABC transport system permease protein